jgi:hypothetical protein
MVARISVIFLPLEGLDGGEGTKDQGERFIAWIDGPRGRESTQEDIVLTVLNSIFPGIGRFARRAIRH